MGSTIRLLAALGLAGLGHYFVAFQRDTYPLDGYMFYGAAAILFASAMRAARRQREGEWNDLSDSLREVAGALRRLVSSIVGVSFGPTLFAGLVALNLFSAVLAALFGSWLALAGWTISIGWLAATAWPRAARQGEVQAAPPVQLRAEADERPGRHTHVVLLGIGLALASFGQVVIAENQAGTPFGAVGDPIADALRLQIPGGGSAVVGFVILAVALNAFAWATRGAVLRDRPKLTCSVHPGQPKGWGGRWLAVAAAGLGLWLLVVRAIGAGATGLGPAALWLAALALIGVVWRKIDLDRGVSHRVELARREAYALIGLTALALLAGLLQIDRLPASIWGDEGAYWTLARDVAAGQESINAFGMGTYGYPLGGSLFQAVWISLFGPGIGSWRFGTVIAVVASLWPLYFLARGLLGRRVAFVALAFYATSPLILAYERTGYLYALSIPSVVTGAALTVAAARRDSRLYAFLAGAASGAGVMLYPSAQFGVVLCALILVAFIAGRLMRGAPALRLSLSFVSAVILSVAPALVYGLVREPAAFIERAFHSSMVNVAFAETVVGRDELLARASFITTRDSQLFFEPALYAGYALRGWLRTAIGLHRSDLFNEHYVVGPLAGPLTLLYVLGLGWCLARARRPGYAIWPIWWFAGTFLLSAIASFPPHTSDLLPVVPALAVLAAVGLVGALDSLTQIAGHARRAGAVLIASTLAVGALGLRTYFVEMPQRYPPSLQMRMFWSALDLPRGSTIVFVRDETYAPDFRPWGMQNFNTAAGWQMIEPAALSGFDFRSACANVCRVFYTSEHAGATETRLRDTVGPGTVTPYVNEAGQAIGYAFDPAGRPNDD